MAKPVRKKKRGQRKSVLGRPFDVISIGDCTMDEFLKLDHVASRMCKKDTDNCYLLLSYADKIVAEDQHFATGGNSSNLAIGSSRLGLKSAFYTVLGHDHIGSMVIESLQKEEVSLEYVKRQKDPTNSSVVLNHEAERTIIVFHHKRRYALPKLKRASWVYYSSMGEGYEKIQPALVKYVKKNKVKLGFNPGTIQLQAGYQGLKSVLEVTEVLLLNTEESERLLGTKHDGHDFRKLLKSLHALGPKKVVVTDGPNGSYAFDGETYWKIGIMDVPVVERTGAGDSTSTGVIAALVHGKPLHEALRWGVFNSASVIQEIGPQKGLLTKHKMQQYLRENPDIQAEEF